MGEAKRNEMNQMARLMMATLVWVTLLGDPRPWVMENHLSTAMAVMVPVDTRVLVPCMVGTSLQAINPRNHLPPYKHWVRVGGMQMTQVEMPEMPRFKMYKFLGVR